ncbi:hypothetical protein QTI66_08690 [Variovorax sp. J22R133]|uniref:hypothetical protein n=1 Tax=Variovorax brevis TaxID=3053503 RepID=UPI0025771372|nr:hypothetical protein [Variovorax sp. J22R133]MDM0112225.1 hypothetical protein [Variovorax sp. J22R133]
MTDITDDRAIEIASKAIDGKVKRQAGAPIELRRSGGRITVTFVHETPPDELGTDYDAQVELDAATGDVLQLRVGA